MEKPEETTASESINAEKPDHHVSTIEHVKEVNNELTKVDTYEDDHHVPLGWRSWLVVFVTLYS
jgi:hypothetical protein